MTEITSFGFEVCNYNNTQLNERRVELRLSSTGDFVAWFQVNERISSGDRIVSTNTQIIYRKELSEIQIDAIRQWLRDQHPAVK